MGKFLDVSLRTIVTSLTGVLFLSGSAAAELPQVAPDCLDLGAYLGDIRRLPDSMYMHRVLLDMSVTPGTAQGKVSDLANRHALDLFDHPDLTTFGLAAAKYGTTYLHNFTAYQSDCKKVVTGDIFSTDGLSVTWEITDHSATQVTLNRLTAGGEAEISSDLTLVMRQFQAIAPMVFTVTSVYRLQTSHACAAGKISELNVAVVTEAYIIEPTGKSPAVPSSEAFTALQARYPRTASTNGRRGDFVAPLTAQNDATCVAPTTPTVLGSL